jgi:predicted CxxxxCH...CXXCH cytochrome family protein
MYSELCPKCHGQGIVSKPPWIPGEVETWTDSHTSYKCNMCNGLGYLTKADKNPNNIYIDNKQ